jgi:hypothetical protein
MNANANPEKETRRSKNTIHDGVLIRVYWRSFAAKNGLHRRLSAFIGG